MTHFADLTQCDYFGAEHAPKLLAVGWLTSGKEYPTGATNPDTFSRLKCLLDNPWEPMMFGGVYECDLCQYDPPCGQTNLFVPDGSVLFVCPALIVHYIAAHHYRPPDAFLAAVDACPDSRTMDYKRKFLISGGRGLIAKTQPQKGDILLY